MPFEAQERRTRLLLLVILALFAALATGYGLVNPLFEAPDEQHHFFTARYVAQMGELPTVSAAAGAARQEAAQPPLYYLLAALIVAQVDTAGVETQLWPNPTVRIGEPAPTNVNSFVHTAQEAWPWQGYALAAHGLRLLSVLLGLGTLLSIFAAGRLMWPARPEIALLATAVVAFLPQFAFLHSAVTNDVLIIFLCSLALWQMLRLWLNGVSAVRLLLLGVTIGLAGLTKMTGLLLLPLAMLLLGLIFWRSRRAPTTSSSVSKLLWNGLALLLPVALLSGPLLWRNWQLYGDPTAVNQFVALAGGPRAYTLRQVWSDMDRVVLSSVAFFGWMNVLPPLWLHATWLGFVVLGSGGAAWALWQRDKNGRPWLTERVIAAGCLALWVLLVSGAWLRFMIQTPADQGRLLFPALLPAALFLAWGIAGWRQRWLLWLVAGLALFTSAYALFTVIPRAYQQARLVEGGSLPAGVIPLDMAMGEGLFLVGVEPSTEPVRPGEWAFVTLYWRAAEPPLEAPLERLGVYGRDNALAGSQQNYHGGGTYPASEWPANRIVRERLGVQVDQELAAPAVLRLLLRITDEMEPVEVARVKAIPATWPDAGREVAADFGGQVTLVAADFEPTVAAPGTAVTVTMRWRVDEAPGRALTTFVHLGDPTQAPLAQVDGPPLGGDYPATYWEAGEVFADRLVLTLPDELPPGSYPMQMGLYDPEDGRRLPVTNGGAGQAQDVFALGTVTVP